MENLEESGKLVAKLVLAPWKKTDKNVQKEHL